VAARTRRSRRLVLLVSGAVAAGGLIALVLASAGIFGESVEHLVRDETAGLRAPTGELLPPVPGPTALVWAVGDADDSADARLLAATVTRSRPDRVLYLGDVYEYGSAASFDAWSRAWGALVGRTAPTPGNHEWGESREGYDPYWQEVHGKPVPSYYTLRAGSWEVVSVNSEADHGAGSEQESWLASYLERATGDCRIVFWHRPRYSAGPRGDTASLEPLARHLSGHARVLLGGHEHNLQRLGPIDGIVQFVVGAGGRGHAPVDRGDPRLAFADDRRTGALRLALAPGRLTWAFVTARGQTIDRGTLRCSSRSPVGANASG
jgi:hypothetical protein